MLDWRLPAMAVPFTVVRPSGYRRSQGVALALLAFLIVALAAACGRTSDTSTQDGGSLEARDGSMPSEGGLDVRQVAIDASADVAGDATADALVEAAVDGPDTRHAVAKWQWLLVLECRVQLQPEHKWVRVQTPAGGAVVCSADASPIVSV